MRDAATPSPGASGAAADREAGASAQGRLARNTAWNVAAHVLPFAAGLATIPVLARELGPARFGLIGLAWAVLEYLTLLDAGLGRATVHFVARRLRDPHGVPGDVVAAALAGQLLLGVAGAALFAALSPWLVADVLDVPAAMRDEARHAFLVLAATVPLALLALSLRGILEAAERFDVAAAVRVPSSTATFVVPAVAAVAGASVPQILLALLGVRALACLATWALVRRVVPQLRWSRPGGWRELRPLAAFGGWVAASNVLTPVFLLLDRMVLGAIAGVAAVGFYTGPYEAVVRMLVLPAALVAAIFPRVSALAAGGAARHDPALPSLYLGAVRAVALPMLGVAAVGLVLAPELLQLWLGPEFAAQSSLATRLLLVGVLVNAVGHVPFAFVQALGRPDLTARFHLLELVLHVPLTLLLVHRWAVVGAAAAWTTRALIDALLVTGAAHRMLGVRLSAVFQGRWWRLAATLAVAVAGAAGLQALAAHGAPAVVVWLWGLPALAALLGALAWRALLPAADRHALRSALVRRG